MKKTLLTSIILVFFGTLNVQAQSSISFIGNPFISGDASGFLWKQENSKEAMYSRFYGTLSLDAPLGSTVSSGSFSQDIGFGLEKQHKGSDKVMWYHGEDAIINLASDSNSGLKFSPGLRPFIGAQVELFEGFSLGSEIGFTLGFNWSGELDNFYISPSHRLIVLTYALD